MIVAGACNLLLGGAVDPKLQWLVSAQSNSGSGAARGLTGVTWQLPPSSTRQIFACVTGFLTGFPTIVSATIGGIPATLHVSASSSTQDGMCIFSAIVPTGVSGDIQFTWSGTVNPCTVHVYAGDLGFPAALLTSGADYTMPLESADLSLSAPSILIALAKNRNMASCSWTGLLTVGRFVANSTVPSSSAGILLMAPITEQSFAATPNSGANQPGLIYAAFG